ncbi:GSCFA domain-containing protein [Tenacibaculum piscium]|uniref:GSCFA domain-containing protein n=1 Tax=Tenacibaculum piscium TaxID=1458515 RepID=A0A2H1YJX2_9FLAO|nr:GSCFA domain-containing protein [Tenacibaculum piscium]MBE7629893.1 GSCFA domain-containing protein [Tenacibaculum piscium]MBE7670305.1 GSCFA domain-containing protein [Tenacibaculum piscium]MBE7685851.1 GSCFA domain-containing protein [Tenacibaculum piscium]MBE7690457.1 GSCFA domain-containing protein [Tenacibaculum piscium]SOS75097.1 GSCFA domain-containing protein [Tenacibaculum piscium]
MKLQTQLSLKKQAHHLIDYNSKLFLLGSCFSENIGDKLSYYKFQSTQNPFGILFHPKAIEKLITDAINQKKYTEEAVFYHNESWHCFDAHSSISSLDKNEVLENLNTASSATFTQLKNASHLIITLGTSWIYREISSDTIVANCHKIPQKNFTKKILSIAEITESLSEIITLTKSVNPDIAILFTVSPVRHLKDGFIENQQSKAHLLSAIHQVTDIKKNVYYFPSYEIMMDELRDYRFYAQDMIHPNTTAINYIWEKFIAVWIAENTQKTMKEVDIIQKGLAHRSFNPTSEAHQKFLKNIAQKKETLQKAFPFIQF